MAKMSFNENEITFAFFTYAVSSKTTGTKIFTYQIIVEIVLSYVYPSAS